MQITFHAGDFDNAMLIDLANLLSKEIDYRATHPATSQFPQQRGRLANAQQQFDLICDALTLRGVEVTGCVVYPHY